MFAVAVGRLFLQDNAIVVCSAAAPARWRRRRRRLSPTCWRVGGATTAPSRPVCCLSPGVLTVPACTPLQRPGPPTSPTPVGARSCPTVTRLRVRATPARRSRAVRVTIKPHCLSPSHAGHTSLRHAHTPTQIHRSTGDTEDPERAARVSLPSGGSDAPSLHGRPGTTAAGPSPKCRRHPPRAVGRPARTGLQARPGRRRAS